jgi:hypothetical protein
MGTCATRPTSDPKPATVQGCLGSPAGAFPDRWGARCEAMSAAERARGALPLLPSDSRVGTLRLRLRSDRRVAPLRLRSNRREGPLRLRSDPRVDPLRLQSDPRARTNRMRPTAPRGVPVAARLAGPARRPGTRAKAMEGAEGEETRAARATPGPGGGEALLSRGAAACARIPRDQRRTAKPAWYTRGTPRYPNRSGLDGRAVRALRGTRDQNVSAVAHAAHAAGGTTFAHTPAAREVHGCVLAPEQASK